MKVMLWAIVVFLVPSIAAADTVGVYADPDIHDFCSVRDVPGPRTLYVSHIFTPGSIGSRFRIEYSSGFTGTLLSFSSPFANVSGDPLTGITVTYDGGCYPGSVHILTLNFMLFGTSPNCSWVRTADVAVTDCALSHWAGHWEGTHVTLGGGASCPNDIDHEEHVHHCRPYSPPLPAAASTWGSVKALYR